MRQTARDAPPSNGVSQQETFDPARDLISSLRSGRTRTLAWLDQQPILYGACILCLTAAGFTFILALLDWVLPSADGWAIYWPYDGIALALLLLTGKCRWPWIVGGFVLAFTRSELPSHAPLSQIVVDICCNVAEILLGAYMLPRFHSLKRWLTEARLAFRFTIFAILLGPALTSLPVAWYFSRIRDTFWHVAMKWAFADALGTALWAPLLLILVSRETYDLFRLKALPQTAFLLCGLFAVSWACFRQDHYPLTFVPYPLLLFVAIRLGFSGAVIGANMLSLVASYLSLRGHGPLHYVSHGWTDSQTVILQVYSTFGMLFVLPLSVILIERRHFAEQLQQALAAMEQLATIDQLTGVANRRRFDQVLDTEWRRAVRDRTPISLLMIDADFFKSFNDRYGHIAGDECLQGIATSLNANPLRQHDLVSRYGGEEFAAILPGAPAEMAEEIAERMRLSVLEAGMRHEDNPPGVVTVSIGCASMVPTIGMTSEDLIAEADRALYIAKENGRNRVGSAAPKLVVVQLQRPA